MKWREWGAIGRRTVADIGAVTGARTEEFIRAIFTLVAITILVFAAALLALAATPVVLADILADDTAPPRRRPRGP